MSFYRKVYKLNITLASPLSIGSGLNESTDKDVTVDDCRVPFIPATSLSGAIRSYVESVYGKGSEIFGCLTEGADAGEGDSRIRVYDALHDGDNGGEKNAFFITSRDTVALVK